MKSYTTVEEITDKEIIVDQNGSIVVINKEAFEKWVEMKGYLQETRSWDEDLSCYTKMSFDEYLNSDYLNPDVKEFLEVRNPANGKLRSMPDLNKAFQQFKAS